jgi:glucokinase
MNRPSVIGVDIGGTSLRAAVVHSEKLGEVLSVPVRKAAGEREVLADLYSVIDPLVGGEVRGLGVGVPSVIDLETGVVTDVQNIPSWKRVALRARLEERYRLPVFLNNDANCFTAGEKHFGKARPFANAVGLIVGTGLGAGVIANGRLYCGSHCGAGEIGMLPYLDRNFESYASGRFFRTAHGVAGEELAAGAAAGDRRALEIFDEFGTHLGEAVKAIAYAFDPGIVVLGGSVSRSFPYFEDSLRRRVRTLAYSAIVESLEIEVSDIEHIAILGAAALFHDAFA